MGCFIFFSLLLLHAAVAAAAAAPALPYAGMKSCLRRAPIWGPSGQLHARGGGVREGPICLTPSADAAAARLSDVFLPTRAICSQFEAHLPQLSAKTTRGRRGFS